MTPEAGLSAALRRISNAVNRQVDVLKRIPEHMDATLYYRTFRPYIRFFENVTYEGVDHAPMQFRGETLMHQSQWMHLSWSISNL